MENSQKSINTKLLILILLTACIMVVLGLFISHEQMLKVPVDLQLTGTLLEVPRSITEFQLVDDEGKVFTKENLNGHWTLMFFGFTNCGYVCPTTLLELSQVYSKLQDKLPANELPQVVMITIDPARDTVANIHNYVKGFNAAFRGATGEKTQIDALAKSLSVLYMKTHQNNTDDVQYKMDHSSAVMLISPKADLRAFFTMPHNVDRLTQDYQSIILHYRV